MSHYTVAVITENEDIESALAPFNENIEVEKYIRKTREETIEMCKHEKQRYEISNDETYKEWFESSSWNKIDYTNDETIIKTFLEEMGDEAYDENGNYWSTYNPDSKWDWYEVGGRWNNMLKLKNGERTNSAIVKNLDFTPDLKHVERHKRFWEVVVEDSPLQEGEKQEDFRSFYNKNYYLKTYSTKENYVKEQTSFSTYAILYHGEWIEPNQMGWFGCSSANKDEHEAYREKFEEIMSNLSPEDWITVVDCHI